MSAETTRFCGIEAIALTHGRYRALLLPDMGANLISLVYRDLQILNCPQSVSDLVNRPYSYGIPILCPPNRIKGAAFSYKGHRFEFAPNLPEGAVLHGVLHNEKWNVDGYGEDENGSWVQASCSGGEHEAIKNGFGEKVCFRVTYRLNENGLAQSVSIRNNEHYHVPFGLAFHTAFSVPFSPEGKAEDVKLTMPLKSRCRLSEVDFYPERIDDELNEYEKQIASDGYPPLQRRIDMLYKRDMDRPNEVCLLDGNSGAKVHYRADDAYRYWIIWNNTTEEGFVGLEPQTWLSNAPYYWQMGERDHGIIDVAPGECVTLSTSIWVTDRLL